jgi:hypothetical protein
MFIIISAVLVMSLILNGLLVWYTRKVVQNLYFGVNNVEELQKLLNEYVLLLEPLVNMENYYADPAIASAINNTRIIIDACKVYKSSILDNKNEEIQEKEQETSKKEDNKETKI